MMHGNRKAAIIRKIQAIGAHIFHGDNGAIVSVSAEHGDGLVDYYGEFRGGYPWIDPRLEAIATEYGLMWEWHNPGAIGLYE